MSGSFRRSELLHGVAAVSAATFFTLFVLALPRPHVAVPLPAPAPSRLRFLPVAEGSAAAESRQIWVPILFSHSTAVGFGRGEEGGMSIHPPLQAPRPEPVFLRRSRRRGESYPPAPAAAPRVLMSERFLDHLRPAPSREGGGGLPIPKWQIEFHTNLDADAFSVRVWPEEAAGARAWEAGVYLVWDEQGTPVRVLVESATRPEVRAAVARALRAWRLSGKEEIRHLRARIRYEPTGQEEDG